jgi:3-oxoacyl-[acyl-carrier-protein] synthase II
LGADAERTWEALLAGRSGARLLQAPWAEDLPVRIAATVDDAYQEQLTTPERRRMDRAEQFAVLAAREAWEQAGIAEVEPDRLAVVIGSAIGGLTTTLEQETRRREEGARRVSPHTVTMMMGNGAAAWVSMQIGARAGARAPVSACASGSEALMMARQMILAGDADVVVAGGTEACVTALTLSALAQVRALSRRNDDPPAASRPFDADRDGFLLGEGAAVLVLESEEHARARGARVMAHLAGAALTSDAYSITGADPQNQARTMSMAVRNAGLAPEDVEFVHAHATSTPLGDDNEASAITESLGRPALTSSKSMVGHLLGASGALGVVVAARALEGGVLPATINVGRLDPGIDADVVTATRSGDYRAGMVNAFGFGGHNVSLVLTRERVGV